MENVTPTFFFLHFSPSGFHSQRDCSCRAGTTPLSLSAGQKLDLDYIYCEVPLEVERTCEFVVLRWNIFSV